MAAVAAVVVVSAMLASDPPGVGAAEAEQNLAQRFLQYKTDYIGNNAKVGGIISLLDFPEDVRYQSFALNTSSEPYSAVLNFHSDATAANYYADHNNRKQFEHAAAIMLSLIGNAGEISFRLSDDNEENLLEFAYSRAWVDKAYGRDVRAFSESEAGFLKLLSEGTSSQPSSKEASYTLMKLGRNGQVLASRRLIAKEEIQLAEDTIFNYMVKSAAWTGVDLDSLEECYMIQASSASNVPVFDYYAFLLEGKAFMQAGKNGQYSSISNELYYSLKELIDRQSGVSQLVEENHE